MWQTPVTDMEVLMSKLVPRIGVFSLLAGVVFLIACEDTPTEPGGESLASTELLINSLPRGVELSNGCHALTFHPTVDPVVRGGSVYGTEAADYIDCRGVSVKKNGLRIYGLGDNDLLRGTRGNDYIYGGRGSDLVIGWSGDDTVDGGPGDDNPAHGIPFEGSPGVPATAGVTGGWGNDIVLGGPGDDEVRGSRGYDICEGGPGSDGGFQASFQGCQECEDPDGDCPS
jgi:hypothetical protein